MANEHTFLFADLAGFTALTEAHGDETAADLAGSFCELAAVELEQRDAEQIKTIGDAVMLRATQANEAISLGLALAKRVGMTPGMPNLRVGMHTGAAVQRGDDWFGATVNLAARVAAAAGGNEVLLTEQTRTAAGDLAEVELESLGRHSFRNVSERIPLFRALADGGHDPSLVDPVCRMTVDPARAAGELRHGNQRFHFCSLECAQAFAADPDSFVDPDGETG